MILKLEIFLFYIFFINAVNINYNDSTLIEAKSTCITDISNEFNSVNLYTRIHIFK